MGKELSSLAPVARLQEKLTLLNDEETSMKELLEDAISLEDKDLETECQEELKKIEESRAVLEKRVIESVLPKDEDDAEAAILEVRAGTGGDEAALFAGDLLDAYSKSAKSQGWKVETLSVTKTDLGGIKEGSVSISGGGGSYGYDDSDDNVDPMAGLGPYGFFKFESGVHRVQRVPVNDVRIHTSACSVAVLPSPSDERADNLLPMSELRIDTMRASGAGGQHVNTTDSAVRITHLPTGITASIQDERSQHKNKAKALKLIAARVMALRRADEARERGDARNSLMGGGDRSERIRTYNFPQDRVTDHRCKESEHGITRLLGGSSEDGLVVTFAPIMRAMSRDEALRQLEEER
jgi:peptide chain release factor 1